MELDSEWKLSKGFYKYLFEIAVAVAGWGVLVLVTLSNKDK